MIKVENLCWSREKYSQSLLMPLTKLANPDVSYIRAQLLVGPPGSEKTHIMISALAFARTLNAPS